MNFSYILKKLKNNDLFMFKYDTIKQSKQNIFLIFAKKLPLLKLD
tara:strand:- start:540 stop:674 length:135 start_codon:yes stop_codon:yes gene_type:complete